MSQDPGKINELAQSAATGGNGLPPIDQWHPDFSGDIDIHITRDGDWLYEGRKLQREAIVRLFSTILRREDDGDYYLVTPVEKWRIRVDDTPLLAHTLEAEGDGREQVLWVTTNMGEKLALGPEHPLRVETAADAGAGPHPVVEVRHGLEARLVTSAYYDLADYCVSAGTGDRDALGVWSNGMFFEVGQGG